MFGCILTIFTVIWWVNKSSPIIPRYETGQINLMSSNFENKSVAHRLHTFEKIQMFFAETAKAQPILYPQGSIFSMQSLISYLCVFSLTHFAWQLSERHLGTTPLEPTISNKHRKTWAWHSLVPAFHLFIFCFNCTSKYLTVSTVFSSALIMSVSIEK